MRSAFLLSLLSTTFLSSIWGAQFSKRDDDSSSNIKKRSCIATLKNANGHNAQHGRRLPFWEAKDMGWHTAFPPGATGHSQATLFTGKDCTVTVHVNLDDCTIDGARFGTPLAGKAL